MTFPKARLVVSAVLFIGWISFLFYLVLETKTIVISRPQFQIAPAVVVASLRDQGGKPDPVVIVKEVLRGDAGLERKLGKEMRLSGLLGCTGENGYAGAGDYVIPLTRRGGVWQIAPIPLVGYRRQSASLGTVEIWDAGANPDCTLDACFDFARAHPELAGDIMPSLMPAIATRALGPSFFGPLFDWRAGIDLPRGPVFGPLPIDAARVLQAQLKKCGAKAEVIVEEVRIYPWVPQVRQQVERVLAGK